MGSAADVWISYIVLSALFLTTYGGCEFPNIWSGQWFQSGVTQLITINSTHISNKGECIENDRDKYIVKVSERNSPTSCYSCIVIHQKHANVLQYKEPLPFCSPLKSLDDLCMDIQVDIIYSMFRAEDAKPIPCPFKSPPYIFSYNGGKKDCSFPPSTADSCTDDSRLLFRYAACPDIPGSESTVEVMVCLALWKDGSSRYLVAKMEHKLATQDEDKYRCFLYEKETRQGIPTYQIAQSGDATCNGVQSPTEGSKTMRLIRKESQHERCKFPSWVVNHHHWHSLDLSAHSYHFSHKNATLRVTGNGGGTETRLICHKIHSNNTSNQVTIIAHVTTGCESGYVCMVFHQRNSHVIQIYQSDKESQDESEACNPEYFDTSNLPNPVTLVTAPLPPVHCPNSGRYVILPQVKNQLVTDTGLMANCGSVSTSKDNVGVSAPNNKNKQHDRLLYDSLAVGCSDPPDTMEFHSYCPDEPAKGYNCHGSWTENSTSYLVVSPASRKSTDAKHYCFVFVEKSSQMVLHRVENSCTLPSHQSEWSFNITAVGKCTESSASKDRSTLLLPSVFSLIVTMILIGILR